MEQLNKLVVIFVPGLNLRDGKQWIVIENVLFLIF